MGGRGHGGRGQGWVGVAMDGREWPWVGGSGHGWVGVAMGGWEWPCMGGAMGERGHGEGRGARLLNVLIEAHPQLPAAVETSV